MYNPDVKGFLKKEWKRLLYFTVFIFIIGPVGVWHDVHQAILDYESWSLPAMTAATFSVTLTVATMADVILAKPSGDQKERNADLKFLYFSLFSLVGFLSSVVFFTKGQGIYSMSSILSIILSFVLWWLINSKNPNLETVDANPFDAVPDGDHIVDSNKEMEEYDV